MHEMFGMLTVSGLYHFTVYCTVINSIWVISRSCMDIIYIYICMSVVRQKLLEQIHNNKQPFFLVHFVYDRKGASCMLSEKLIKITLMQKFIYLNKLILSCHGCYNAKETMFLSANIKH